MSRLHTKESGHDTHARRGVSAVSTLSLRRDPIRLVLSRGPWAAAWYLLGYLAVGRGERSTRPSRPARAEPRG
jgi:hypothetical protein